jgi:hypothetical protein
MQRHRTDFVALFFGLAFAATGTGFIVHQTTGHAFDASWIAATALVSIGCIFLGATLLRGPRSSPSVPATVVGPPVPEPEAEAEPEPVAPSAATAEEDDRPNAADD